MARDDQILQINLLQVLLNSIAVFPLDAFSAYCIFIVYDF